MPLNTEETRVLLRAKFDPNGDIYRQGLSPKERDICESLCKKGFLRKLVPYGVNGEVLIYHITDNGRTALKQHEKQG